MSGSDLGAAAAAWAGERRVRVGPWRVRYREAGEGPPIVLVHGLGVSADYWYRNGPWLAAVGYRALAPDLPGFGRTEGPPDGLSIPEQAQALRRWAGAMGLESAVYVGHSVSCQTVLQLAVDAPALVRGLLLAAPTGDREAAPRMARQAWGFLLDVWREPWRLVPPVAQAYLRAGPVRWWHTWRDSADHDPLPLLPRVRAPGWVVIGERDPLVSRDFADRLAAGLPEGRVVVVPGAAHAVIFDRARGFNRVAREFLERVYPALTGRPAAAPARGRPP